MHPTAFEGLHRDRCAVLGQSVGFFENLLKFGASTLNSTQILQRRNLVLGFSPCVHRFGFAVVLPAVGPDQVCGLR